ncbi:MAG: hypothetical protein ABIT83_11450 [Massilia sp.]
MAIYDLYGSSSNELESARASLESAFGINFSAHDSEYYGGDYFRWGKSSEEHLVLKRNIDPIDGDPAEQSFPDYRILLYVNESPRWQFFRERIIEKATCFVLLRHEDLE